ncbi:MAG: CooT family nickel-binding protein [Nitrospiraceae bacterium]|jgi:predicted RNA-binding protein|nr:CooT family nickel-binding protein [Nitrospiraceae bacterium]
MCETNAYSVENNKEVLLFQGVVELRDEGGALYLKNEHGMEMVFYGEIQEVSLLNHRILLKRR